MGKIKRDLKFLRSVLYDAGKLLLSYQNGKIAIEQEEKESYASHDLVTAADFASQNFIMQKILANFPNDMIIGEETIDDEELSQKIKENIKSNDVWTTDPVSGILNFSRGTKEGEIPSEKYSVSLSYAHEGYTLMGGLYFPRTKELFLAQKDQCSKLGKKNLKINQEDDLSKSVIAACVPFLNKKVIKVNYSIAQKCRAFESFHCATYSLNLLLKGQIQGYIHPCLKECVSAGILLVEEAGGRATNQFGEEWNLRDYFVATGGGKIHDELCKLIRDNY